MRNRDSLQAVPQTDNAVVHRMRDTRKEKHRGIQKGVKPMYDLRGKSG